jgi:N-acetylneuraminic acid mutarotase
MKYPFLVCCFFFITTLAYAQNIGIGTASPAAKLHVSAGDASIALFGPSAVGGQLFVGASSSNPNVALTAQLLVSDGNLHIDPAAGKNLYLGFYQPRDIFMNPNGGNVGIGTTSTGNFKLRTVGWISSSAGLDLTDANTNGNTSYTDAGPKITANTMAGNAELDFISPAYDAGPVAFSFLKMSGTNGSYTVDKFNPLMVIKRNGKVGIGSSEPDPSARLDVSSTTEGFLPPRMTTAQRNAIVSPATGLQVYNTDINCLEFWNSAGWISVCSDKILFNGIMTVGCTDAWTQKRYFGGNEREHAVSFSIGNKGYLGTGYDGTNQKKDFWEYDPVINAWTQKADFGGTARSAAVGFSIGNKGYIGTGGDGGLRNDFWEYDPDFNEWTQKADFGGTARGGAVGFSIGPRGYIGTGSGSSNILRKDFWEYSPGSDQWTQKTDFGGTARSGAVGFSINAKGYIGTGVDAASGKKDFWEYNPVVNEWIQKSDFGGTARSLAAGLSIAGKGYIGTGADGGLFKNDFWEYDPASNAWMQKSDFVGTGRRSATGFSIGTKGFLGTGIIPGSRINDFWEYCQ